MRYGDSAEFWDSGEEKVIGIFIGLEAGGLTNDSIDSNGRDKIYLCRNGKRYSFIREIAAHSEGQKIRWAKVKSQEGK
jgi:hypothetical protein